nr:hypothetical protein [Tanacetum cinerariifolium]
MVKTNLTLENEACYLKSCKKNTDNLNSKITDLTDKLFDATNMIYHYKLGLAQVESRLVEHKDREIKYCEKIRGLEFRTESNNECIEIPKKKLEILKKEKEGDMSWTSLLEFADDTVTNYSRPSPTIESTSSDDQNKNPSVTKTEASPSTISPKPFIKFMKASERSTTNKFETVKKPSVKFLNLSYFEITQCDNNIRRSLINSFQQVVSDPGLAQVESRLVEHKDRKIKYCEKIRGLEFRTESNNECIEIPKKKLEILKKEKEGRADNNKDGLGYSIVPPPPAQIYSSPKKDMSWTSLLEFADDTVTDYSRPSPTIESTSGDDQNKNPSVTKTEASPSTISPKPFIKFMKASERSTTNKVETVKKPSVKYAELYQKTTKRSTVKGNQQN